jgi:hypothetical protein
VTLDAKLAMAEVVLRGVDRANRRRLGLPEAETEATGSGQWGPAEPETAATGSPAEPPRWPSQPVSPAAVSEPQAPADAAQPEWAPWPARGVGG